MREVWKFEGDAKEAGKSEMAVKEVAGKFGVIEVTRKRGVVVRLETKDVGLINVIVVPAGTSHPGFLVGQEDRKNSCKKYNKIKTT